MKSADPTPESRSEAFREWWRRMRETGDICPVALGDTRARIRELLGEPDDVGGTSRQHRLPRIWKYGSVEFHFGPRQSDGLDLIYAEMPDGTPFLSIPRQWGR